MAAGATDPWDLDETQLPEGADVATRLRFAVRCAILAPSSHNTQPWLFRLRANCVELRADRTRALPVADPEDRELLISCGSALFNLRVALRRLGHRPDVQLFPEHDDPDLLAAVRVAQDAEPAPGDLELFRAIPARRTSRRRFENRDVPQETVGALVAAAAAEGGWFVPVLDPAARDALADLVAEGDRLQGADRAFRREMAAWAHPLRARSRDGLPGFAYGTGDLGHFIGPTVLRTFETAAGHAAEGRELAAGSPLLAVLGTGEDRPESWITAGQALERVLLLACARGLQASYLDQPIEIAALRTRVRELLRLSGAPQLILRLGFGDGVPATPRRPVEEVLLS